MNIGQTIKELRKWQGMSQKDFAMEVGISANALCTLENNRGKPSMGTLEKMAKVLDIPFSLFLLSFVSEDDFPEDKKILYPILKQITIELCQDTKK